MNNEIKEKIKAYYVNNDIDEVLDCITNLQEELKIRDTNWQSLKYYLEKLYYKDYIEEEIFDDICKRVNELESQIEIKGYQKVIKDLQEENERLKKPDYYEKGLIGSIKERDGIIQDYKSRCEKAINILELSSQNKGMCTRPETDTIQSALIILKGDKDEL